MADTQMDKWNEIPPYLVGFVHDDEDDEDEPDNDENEVDEGESDDILTPGPDADTGETVDEPDSGETDDDDIQLFPPDSFSIVSQNVRVSADGRSVVDVVIEVEDVPGIVQYDVRVTKI